MGTIVTSNTDTFHAGRYMYLQDRAFSTIPNNSVNSDPKSDTNSPDWQRQHKISGSWYYVFFAFVTG